MANASELRVAVLIPCYNEEVAIGPVIRAFREALPEASVHVYDNNSTDETVAVAVQAGATIGRVPQQGKGNVVRRMFADVSADVYVLVDGDATYHAPSARTMVDVLVSQSLDMVVARRVTTESMAYRAGHQFGNRMLTECIALLFGRLFTDVLSGYRVFSRRFVKSFPALSSGFEIETELTVHALELRMPVAELESPYQARPQGSASKLRTYQDGLRILITILNLYRQERPLTFFSIIGGILATSATVLAIPLLVTYAQTGLVPRLPTAVLVASIMLSAILSIGCGLVLDTVTRARNEAKRLVYLGIPIH